MSDQYIRKWQLVLSAGESGLDLSELRMQFRISQADTESPNTALIRVYNLKTELARSIAREFQRVTLQAGYETGRYGIVFDGTIKQVRRGREDSLTSFVDIMAADGDEAYNFGIVVKALAAGASPRTQFDVAAAAMEQHGVSTGYVDGLTGGTLPRGKVLFGLARARMSDVTESTGTKWSIVDGKINVIPLTGYMPGEAVKLSAQTGLIGVPEATIQGIECRVLLNPAIRIGQRVQIDNAAINELIVLQQGQYPNYGNLTLPATVTDDGFYRVLVAEHQGDNRGQPWYTDLTCLSIDPSSAPQQSVQAAG